MNFFKNIQKRLYEDGICGVYVYPKGIPELKGISFEKAQKIAARYGLEIVHDPSWFDKDAWHFNKPGCFEIL